MTVGGGLRVAMSRIADIAIGWNPLEFLAVPLWMGAGGIVSSLARPVLVGSLWRRAIKTAATISFSAREEAR